MAAGPRFINRLKLTSATTGSGTLTCAVASGPWNPLTKIADGDWGYFTCAGQSGSEWETFEGTVGGSGTTLTRDVVLDSSNGGAAVNFSAGTKDVFNDPPAAHIANRAGARFNVPTFFA